MNGVRETEPQGPTLRASPTNHVRSPPVGLGACHAEVRSGGRRRVPARPHVHPSSRPARRASPTNLSHASSVSSSVGLGLRPDRRPSACAGFTLLEMLAVVAIMGIVMAIATVQFTSLTRGAAAKGAARQVHAAIRLARQYAVTRRIPVAFIVCDAKFASRYPKAAAAEGVAPEKYFGKAYAVFDLRHRRYLRAWEELPQNTTFDDRSVGGSVMGKSIMDLDLLADTIPFPGDWNVERDYQCQFKGILFKPDGRAEVRRGGSYAAWYRWVLVCEGAFDVTGKYWERRGKDISLAAAKTLSYGVQIAHAGNARIEIMKDEGGNLVPTTAIRVDP